MWRWILGVIIVLTSLSLLATVMLTVFFPVTPEPEKEDALSVSLTVDGETIEAEISVGTVGDLLTEQNVTLGEDDYISFPVDTPLSEGMDIYIMRARDVTLIIDGETQTFRTTFENPLDILDSAGLSVGENDYIFVDGTQTTVDDLALWLVPASHITVNHALPIVVDDDGAQFLFNTLTATVGEALFEADVTLYLADEVTPDLNTPVTANMQVAIVRSLPVTVVADDVRLDTRVQMGTVADALDEAGVALMGLDYSVPSESEGIFPGMVIQVVRVTEGFDTEQSFIPYETVYRPDETMELDTRMTVQAGQSGAQETTYRIRYEDGVEVRRESAGTVTVQAPVDEIVAYGTNIVIRSVDTPEGPREYWRVINMLATSYHPAALGGDNITATGATLTKGIVGTRPNIIPYHTELYVPGYGIGMVEDTGTGPSSTQRWIDLGYDDDNWVSWSRRVDVYLLTPIPAEINYLLPE